MGVCDFWTPPAQPEPPARDEATVGTLQRVDDFCRRLEVDATNVMPAVEGVIKAVAPLRAAASKMNSRERRVIGDALGEAIREGMK